MCNFHSSVSSVLPRLSLLTKLNVCKFDKTGPHIDYYYRNQYKLICLLTRCFTVKKKKERKESVMSNLRTHIYLHILFLIIPCYNILVQSWCKNVNTLCILYYSIYIYFERTTCKNTSRY